MPCILDNFGMVICYQISNMILINARLLLVHFFIMSNFMSFYVHVYVLYELFFVHNVVRLLFCVNMCACRIISEIYDVPITKRT